MDAWIETTWMAALMVVLSTLGIYASVMLLTRLAGLRSFSKMSSFDFGITVAIGAVIASTLIAKNPPLLQGAVALAALYGVQIATAILRQHFTWARSLIDNQALLLMAGDQIIKKNLRKARMTEEDLRGKLREANVIDYRQIRAVVMETTGDVSVLHASPDDPDLDPDLLEGVADSELVFQKSDVDEEKTADQRGETAGL